MDRMESRHEDLAKEVATLTVTTGQIVLNQKHAEDLNELRFKSLDSAVGLLATDLKGFMTRIDGIITGETETIQARQGRELVADYMTWRKATDQRLTIIEDVPTLITRVDNLEDAAQRRGGAIDTMIGAKGIALMIASFVAVTVSIISLMTR
jgi:hypothetical protein